MAFTDANVEITVNSVAVDYYDINDKNPKLGAGRHRRAQVTDGVADLTVSHRDEKGAIARHELKHVRSTQTDANVKNQEHVIISCTHENGDLDAQARALLDLKAMVAWLASGTNCDDFVMGLS